MQRKNNLHFFVNLHQYFYWLSDRNPEIHTGLSDSKIIMGCLRRPECPYFVPCTGTGISNLNTSITMIRTPMNLMRLQELGIVHLHIPLYPLIGIPGCNFVINAHYSCYLYLVSIQSGIANGCDDHS